MQQRYQHHHGQTDVGMHTTQSTGWTSSTGEQEEEISVSSSTGRHRASSDSYLGPRGGGAAAAAAHSAPAQVRASFDSSCKRTPQQQQDELSDQMVRQLQLPSPLPPADMHQTLTASSRGSASSGCSKPSQKSGWSMGFGLGRQDRSGSHASDVDQASQGEDAGSVCSTTSGESKRSVGKSMMGLLKKVQYTMVRARRPLGFLARIHGIQGVRDEIRVDSRTLASQHMCVQSACMRYTLIASGGLPS